MRERYKRFAGIYVLCLFSMVYGMMASGCGNRRCSYKESPYTVYNKPAACQSVAYDNHCREHTYTRPQSRYWSDCRKKHHPYYSKGWYHSDVPYGRDYRQLHFGCPGY